MMTEIHPNQIIRVKDAPFYFGISPTQIDVRVKAGIIPPPMELGAGCRAKGWLGSQILEYQNQLKEAARVKAEQASRNPGGCCF